MFLIIVWWFWNVEPHTSISSTAKVLRYVFVQLVNTVCTYVSNHDVNITFEKAVTINDGLGRKEVNQV